MKFLFFLKLFLIIEQYPHSVLIKVSELIIIDLFKDLNIKFIILDKLDEISCVFIIECLKQFNKPFQLFDPHWHKIFEQKSNTYRHNNITTDVSTKTHYENVLYKFGLSISVHVGFIHLNYASLDLLALLNYVEYRIIAWLLRKQFVNACLLFCTLSVLFLFFWTIQWLIISITWQRYFRWYQFIIYCFCRKYVLLSTNKVIYWL